MTERLKIVHSPNEDYARGYRHGADSNMPNTTNVWNREAYFEGYVKGLQDRDGRMAGGKDNVVNPEWMTPKQVEAVNQLYKQNPDGSPDRYEFFTRVQKYGIGSDRFATIEWCGRLIRIGQNGFTHT
jgi:hypothetical protein